MPPAWTTILAERAILSEADLAALKAAPCASRNLRPREMIASEGDPADTMIVVVEGWAARCKTLKGGDRQIVGFMLPGDFTVVYRGVAHRRSDDILALTRCEVIEIEVGAAEDLARARSAIDRIFQHSAMVDSAITQEWLTNLGRRSAERRLAHLFCELSERLQAARLADGSSFRLPITQITLGDALGLSSAHINRTLQGLQSAGLAALADGAVTIHDQAKLRKFAGFDPAYLK